MLRREQKGFTLIELLIVLVVTSILLASLLSSYVASLLAYQRSINQAHLDESLQSSMLLMTNDIRRAGFWKNASTDINANSNHNPFMLNDITVNAANNCILFTYDKNGLGSLPAIGAGTDDERYGFQLMNSAIQARPTGAAYSCGAATWTNITDPTVVTITQLTFTLTNSTISIPAASGSPTLTVRTVNVSMTGQLVSNSAVTKTISQLVLVQNDKYTP